MSDEITSFSNPLVKRLKRLRQKKYRRQEGAFYIEGLRVVLSAVEHGAAIETIVYCPERLTSALAWEMLRQQEAAGVRCQALAGPIFSAISERDNPVGLGAVVRADLHELADLTVRPDDIIVASFETGEPGNLGTIMRTMDAVGARSLILVGDTVDPYHPTTVKASMGTLFTMTIGEAPSGESLLNWSAAQGLQTVASSAKANLLYSTASYRLPLLLLLGSEGTGLPVPLLESCELAVSIPMAGTASSLNLAVAAGLLLYEIRRLSAP